MKTAAPEEKFISLLLATNNMVNEARLGRALYAVFASYSMSFLIWGLISASGILTLKYFSPLIPKWLTPLSAALGPLALMVGNVAMGRLSDLVGRRNILFLTMSIYSIGLIGMALSIYLNSIKALPIMPIFILFLVAYMLSQFGIGGEEPPALAALTELMPPERRGMALVIVPNFANVGAVIGSLVVVLGVSFEVTYVALISMILITLATIAVAAAIRLALPESVRWLKVRGRVSEAIEIAEREGLKYALEDYSTGPAVKMPPTWFRALFLSLIGVTQLSTYGLMAYYITLLGTLPISSSEYLSSLTILLANLGASLAGLIGLAIDSISRKSFTLISYLGGLVTMIPIFIIYGILVKTPLASSLTIFFILLFLNMVFSEFGWAVRTLLEPELFPTGVRATWIGVVRLIAWSIYIYLIYYLLSSASTYLYLLANLILYGVGAAASLAWFIYGVETRGIPVGVLDKASAPS